MIVPSDVVYLEVQALTPEVPRDQLMYFGHLSPPGNLITKTYLKGEIQRLDFCNVKFTLEPITDDKFWNKSILMV